MDNRVLVVAPHPDDETLGCGGSILRDKDKGCDVYWLIISNMNVSSGWSEFDVSTRQNEIDLVASMYDFTKTYKLDLPATMLDTIPYRDLVSQISDVFNEVKPSMIYVPNRSDVHTDHQVTFKAVLSCCKSFRSPFIKRILMYECLSETEFSASLREDSFVANVFVDISSYFNRKLKIFRTYQSEVMKPPWPRSAEVIESLARYRGSRIGVKYAEAFVLIQEIL